MSYFVRGEQSEESRLCGVQVVFRALIGLVLLATLLPLRQVSAEEHSGVFSNESGNQLVYKTFGDPELTYADLPAPCEGSDECDADSTDFYKPFGPMVEGASTSAGRSGMAEVQTTDMWPYTPTVKLISYWPSGEATTCSGMMVDAKVVLTAGSCIYSHDPALCADGDSSCWVSDVSAMPAYADGEAPYGQSGYETIMTWTDWTDGQNLAFDLAAIRLRYPIGVTTGWLGIGFNNDDAAFTENSLDNTSYPQDAPYDGERMYDWGGIVTDAATGQPDVFYIDGTCDTGRTGASLNGDDGVAYGVFSHNDATSRMGITRITYSKFDSLRTFIQEGQPKADDGDLIPFDVRAEPDIIFPDQKLSDFSFYLQNYSETAIAFDSYQVNIYLSTDPLINGAEDLLLHTFTYESEFAANEGLRVTLPEGQEIWIPEEIHGSEPLGDTFYLGVTITGSAGNPENADNNRSEYQQPDPIWVYDSDNNTSFFPLWRR
jgi:V8-like Glu-specific endopeptidase